MLPVRRRGGMPTVADPFWRLENEFGQLVRGMFGDGGQTMLMGAGYNVNIWEDDDHLYVEAELPGIKPEDVDVTLENGMLTIRGEKQERTRSEGETSHLTEFSHGQFSRSFSLPVGVDEDKVDAQLKDGILRITLDKRPEAKPRKIKVQT